ncbi:hypothetical protein ACGFRB_23520 [Streptomyces sp. NPDC048718]|uniref:hypothetical protein n=1 Tax=Streptomyces sp. NPDC048718 TaxID=3365587 RepID=UPI00371B34F0
MTDQNPDFGTEDFVPTSAGHEQLLDLFEGTEFKVLGEYRTWTDAYFVLHDESATWGIPGSPQLRAVHVSRDLRERTYQADAAELPLYAMAESWLISRGCPAGAIPTPAARKSADDATRALEARVREAGSRFALLTSYTDDQRAEPETAVVLRALDPQDSPEFRVLLESYDRWTGTHTLSEGGFATREDAAEWWGAWMEEEAPPLVPPASPARGPVSSSLPVAPSAPTVTRSPGR